MPQPLIAYLDADRQRRIETVRAAAARIWATPLDRRLPDHGPAHADRVVTLLDGLTEGLMRRGDVPLHPEEIVILLAAAHLHAVGLQDERAQPDVDARWANYPALGAALIYRALEVPEQAVELGLDGADATRVEMIARLVAAHTATDYPSRDYNDMLAGGATLRMRLLAALLHLADGLDLDCRRVDLDQLRLLNLAPDDELVWRLHHYVSGVQIADEYVQVAYRLPQGMPDYEKCLPELVEKTLRADFDQLRDVFRLHGVKPDIATPRVHWMRAVRPMPDALWALAQARLAPPVAAATTPAGEPALVTTVRGLLETMGYTCGAPEMAPGERLLKFRCTPHGGGLREPIVVGCRAGGPAEVADVDELMPYAGTPCRQAYLIAEARVLNSVRERVAASDFVRAFTLAEFYRSLLDFVDYVKRLVDDYASSELAGYYVDLGCVRHSYNARGELVAEDRHKPIDNYLDAWLRETATSKPNHILILGDPGTGKTSFCRQYAAKQGRRWLTDADRERAPVLINLRDYTKALKMESLVTDTLVNQYGIRDATFEAFMRFNADGKLLILFDGFDEMAQRSDAQTAVDNFWELARVVVPGSKVLLTCRTTYFRTHHEAEALLQGYMLLDAVEGIAAEHSEEPCQPRAPHIDLRNRPNFEILHLELFSGEDIQAVLSRRFPQAWPAQWARIQRVYDLPELAQRPVLLDMICRSLPEIKDGETINAARLYQVYTAEWLERDVRKGRTLVTPDDRRLFAEELAMAMLGGGELSIHYSRIPARVKAHFRLEKAEEIDHFEADVRTCNFLNRDEAGNYAFAHKSFTEFFAAGRLHRLMLQELATSNGPVPINEDIRRFLTGLFELKPEQEADAPFGPPDGFVWVPPGEFILGGQNGLTLQIARLEHGFFAARAPVTNAEYRHFVEAGGYREQRFWSQDGWKAIAQEGLQEPRYWRHGRFNAADQPVVGVSWYEAEAYCRWLAEQNGMVCRLPTEMEWEKAARSCDGREYPWGEWATRRCNTFEANVGKPTPVGIYSPAGDSPYGLQDVAGNVREWTDSVWDKWSTGRVMRGGSWFFRRDSARCAFRYKIDLGDWVRHNGFRVVVSPVSPPSGLWESGGTGVERCGGGASVGARQREDDHVARRELLSRCLAPTDTYAVR